MDKITMNDLSGLFEHVGKVMADNAGELCEMDARMGDGDLGLTMKKGFGGLPEIINSIDDPDMGKKLAQAGMKMASLVPSTMGTLMASGIMAGGKMIAGKSEIDAAGFVAYLKGFAEGIAKRGKCMRGDRTVLDAVGSGADKAAEYLDENPAATLEQVAAAALAGADDGVEATRSMLPKFGKAAAFSIKAAGTVDQGAVAGRLMIRGYYEFISKQR